MEGDTESCMREVMVAMVFMTVLKESRGLEERTVYL